MQATVYLAGPITGLSYEGATDWRESALEYLASHGISATNPMRGKDYLLGKKDLAQEYKGHVMSTQKGITSRDRFDCLNAGVVIANFLGAEKVSVGTVMECAWADSNRVPLILVIEDEGNVHDHAMIREAAGFRVSSLKEGLDIAVALLKPYV